MISERDIAEKFSVVWKQHFPLLTPNFIRVFNEAQIKKINTKSIPSNEEVRYDLISEVAFNLSGEVIAEKETLEAILCQENRLIELTKITAKEIWKSGNYSQDDLTLSKIEIEEIAKICNNILEFIRTLKRERVQFKPQLKGYSFIPDLVADLSMDDTLYEIKTVNRNFKSSDLKQLFIYLALRQVSEGEKWKYAGLYNPRKGTYCRFNIKSLIYSLTGGKSPNEAFENLLSSLTRDIEIDSKF